MIKRLFRCAAQATAFALLTLICTSCMAQNEISRIEYESGTRTFREQIIITADSIITIQEDFRKRPEPVVVRKKTSANAWRKVTAALQVKPEELEGLKAPSDKRTYDAASHSSIKITVGNSKSYSHGFDDDDPNDKLKPFLKTILDLKQGQR
jgi:hypothetical protein